MKVEVADRKNKLLKYHVTSYTRSKIDEIDLSLQIAKELETWSLLQSPFVSKMLDQIITKNHVIIFSEPVKHMEFLPEDLILQKHEA